ncbi:hypothetical protein ACGFXB_09685 [Streptomyces canus]|uniref:hypothetical protein n=1 Tax=Streptomyces canus TaxID=58343 RepID=UPI003722C626
MACDDPTRDNVVEWSMHDLTASTDNDVNSVGAVGWTTENGANVAPEGKGSAGVKLPDNTDLHVFILAVS